MSVLLKSFGCLSEVFWVLFERFGIRNMPGKFQEYESVCTFAAAKQQVTGNLLAVLIAYNLLPIRPEMNIEIIDKNILVA